MDSPDVKITTIPASKWFKATVINIYGSENEINECKSKNRVFPIGFAEIKPEICPKSVNGMVTIVIIISE